MKKFVSENWYKMMIGSSLLMASFGFMVHSLSPAMANNGKDKVNINSNYKMVPTNADGSINVKLSDEQLDKIIPKNNDGSLNVRFSPNSVMDVNIEEVGGYSCYSKLPVVIKENQDK
jgi:hypothetical protein